MKMTHRAGLPSETRDRTSNIIPRSYKPVGCLEHFYVDKVFVTKPAKCFWFSNEWHFYLNHLFRDSDRRFQSCIYPILPILRGLTSTFTNDQICWPLSIPAAMPWLSIPFRLPGLTHLPLAKKAAILADDIFKCSLLNENDRISIQISLKFVPRNPIDNKPAMIQVMAWRWIGDKPLPAPMMAQFTDAYMRRAGVGWVMEKNTLLVTQISALGDWIIYCAIYTRIKAYYMLITILSA